MYKKGFLHLKSVLTDVVPAEDGEVCFFNVALAGFVVFTDCRYYLARHRFTGQSRSPHVLEESPFGVTSSLANISRIAPAACVTVDDS